MSLILDELRICLYLQLQADKANLLDQLQRRGDISNELQQLLMLTYIKEHSHWVDQKSTAEKQLSTARKEVGFN